MTVDMLCQQLWHGGQPVLRLTIARNHVENDLLSMEISEKCEIFQNFITFSGLANDLGCATILLIHP